MSVKRLGRPRKTLPVNGYSIIEDMASRGCSENSIGFALNMCSDTWIALKHRDPKARDALERGRAVEHDALHGVLYEAAVTKGNIVAAMFLLKCRHGSRDQQGPVAEVNTQMVVEVPPTIEDIDEWRKQYSPLEEQE